MCTVRQRSDLAGPGLPSGRPPLDRPRSEPREEPDVPTTVMLVEDHHGLRDALSYVLSTEPDLELVAVAADADAALAAGMRTKTQVVVMDIRLPGRDGVDATRELCRELADVRVVILSVSCTRELVTSAFAAGACGYLVKNGSHRQLIDAIHLAAEGGRPLADSARRLLGT